MLFRSIGKFVSNEKEEKEIDNILTKHLKGENVMGQLKEVISISLERYLKEFQSRKSKISDLDVEKIVESGRSVAKVNAQEMIQEIREAMALQYT